MSDEIHSVYTAQSEVVFQLKRPGLSINKDQTLQILDKSLHSAVHTWYGIITLLVGQASPHFRRPRNQPPIQPGTYCQGSTWMFNTPPAPALWFHFLLSIFTWQDQSLFLFFLPLCPSGTWNSHFNLTQLIPFPSLKSLLKPTELQTFSLNITAVW